MKERPILFSGPMVRAILEGRKTQTRRVCKGQRELSCVHDFQVDRCPYGQPGDRLWVRETFSPVIQRYGSSDKPFAYKADLSDGEWYAGISKWKSSIHMPRWASRILLEITAVRVERLQDISEEDAKAEGAEPYRLPCHPDREGLRHIDGFSLLWRSINGRESWDANPWVWVIEFKRVTP